MSFGKVKEYFEGAGLGRRVVEREQIGATVEQAAESIGCKPEHIAKTMAFFLDEKAVLIVMAGYAKIDNKKYKSCFHQKAKMIPGELVEAYIWHVPGAICPFAVNEGVRTFLDVSLKRFDIIYTVGGNLNSTVKLSLEELETHSSSSGWVDVCKDWFVNEAE
ncbi:YbaK/EbsC family protein [Clostridium sp. BJN0013]|uniref:YbaK/EbsC family protein n=1 Tax=Clostridium sp. BJN0013 TaxID=3236840 RepID=UPI0034C5F36A